MFGLMRAKGCGADLAVRENRRLHYCGTCKSMGRMYGQKSRMLLNHDAVFLGELLTALQGQPTSFAPAYISRSCASIPREQEIPWALRYAATANLVLAHFKIADHVEDNRSLRAWLASRLYAPEFVKAKKQLLAWKFPYRDLESSLSLQTVREREESPSLERLSEPTAEATRLVFGHGAAHVRPEAAATMGDLGVSFGQIAYLVDAIQDQEEDAKTGAFNALAATGMTKAEAVETLRARQKEMGEHIALLPIDNDEKSLFRGRLRANLAPLLAGQVLSSRRTIRSRSSNPDVTIVKVRRTPSCFCCCDGCDCACCACEACECCSCLADGCCCEACSSCG